MANEYVFETHGVINKKAWIYTSLSISVIILIVSIIWSFEEAKDLGVNPIELAILLFLFYEFILLGSALFVLLLIYIGKRRSEWKIAIGPEYMGFSGRGKSARYALDSITDISVYYGSTLPGSIRSMEYSYSIISFSSGFSLKAIFPHATGLGFPSGHDFESFLEKAFSRLKIDYEKETVKGPLLEGRGFILSKKLISEKTVYKLNR